MPKCDIFIVFVFPGKLFKQFPIFRFRRGTLYNELYRDRKMGFGKCFQKESQILLFPELPKKAYFMGGVKVNFLLTGKS